MHYVYATSVEKKNKKKISLVIKIKKKINKFNHLVVSV